MNGVEGVDTVMTREPSVIRVDRWETVGSAGLTCAGA
jgi:hypothetical protein